jgi:hypothetical protein
VFFFTGAANSHAAGYPMSQREKSGLSAPRFSVEAVEDVEVGPETSSAA